MKRIPVILLLLMTLSLMECVAVAQAADHARDFMYIGIDPGTLTGGQNSDIYLVRSDGSRVTNLTDTPLDSENQAYWSDDGKQIYFSRNSMALYPGSTDEQSSTSFYVMDISDDGEKTDERLLFHLGDVMGRPVRVEDWVLAPDKQKLLFIPYDESGGMYLVNIDGTNLREKLAKGVASTYIPLQWSPDSTEFAYETNQCGTIERKPTCPYWVAQAESDQAPDQIDTAKDLMKRWYPDGLYVVLNAGVFEAHHGDDVIWKGDVFTPAVAPDGSAVAFSEYSNLTSTGALKTTDIKNGQQAELTETDQSILFIYWSPDSQQIAFCVYLGSFNDLEVYTIKPDGSDLKKLFRRQSWSRNPLAWRPDAPPKVGV